MHMHNSEKTIYFQHATRVESKEILDYDDGQEQEEEKEEIKHSHDMLEEAENNTIEDFLSPVKALEQQQDLMTESSNETIRSCCFETDKLCMIAGIVEDKPSFGIVLYETESCLANMMKNVFLKKTR